MSLMPLSAIGAILVAGLLGSALVGVLWPRQRGWRGDLAIILSLGVPVGMGVTSALFFAASLISGNPALVAGVLEGLAICGLLVVLRRRASLQHRESGDESPRVQRWMCWLLASVFTQLAVVAAVIATRGFHAEPFGGWDAWAIWNMHARFMLRADTDWPEFLAVPQLSWTHPDYPRLVPASVARAWAWTGAELPQVSAAVSAVFALATVAMLVAAVARVRRPTVAFGGGLLLIGTPFFVTFALNQHADIPLGCFMLATLALAVLAERSSPARGLWLLTGLAAGFAAWAKNEGLLFAAAFAVAAVVWQIRRGSKHAGGLLLAGLALGLVPVVALKLISPANDLLAAPLGPRLAQLFDPARHRLILAALWRDLNAFGEWKVVPFVAMIFPFAAWRWRRRLVGAERLIPAMLGLMLAGYYAVYLLSPHDLTWHLDTSLVRLLLQLWPLALFVWCLSLPSGAAAQVASAATPVRPWRGRAIVVSLNVTAGAAVLFALSRQLAATELAALHSGGTETRVALGGGWFGVERHERETWAWSAGNAHLLLHVGAPAKQTSAPIRLTLQFGLRSIGPRTVTVRVGERVLWEGRVGDALVPVIVPDVELPAGVTRMDFTTDAAGVVESPAHGGRTLAFALYNMRLKP